MTARNLIPDYKEKCYDTTILMISSYGRLYLAKIENSSFLAYSPP